jgi:putative transposase
VQHERRGNCYDNAVMESFFSTVKSELADRFDSCGDAKMALFDYIEVFCNQRRRHSTLGQISPAAFERRDHRFSVREKNLSADASDVIGVENVRVSVL